MACLVFSHVLALYVSLSLLWMYAFAEDRHLVLSPKKRHQRNILLLIIPEKGIPHRNYKRLGVSIQTHCPYQLWVAIANVKDKELEVQDLPGVVYYVKFKLRQKGYYQHNYDMFLAGHGKSGTHVHSYASIYQDVFVGVILLGSSLQKGHVSSLPVPVMTLTGDMDNVVKISQLANMMDKYSRQEDEEDWSSLRNPFIILSGVDHSGYVSSGRSTLPSVPGILSKSEAIEKIASMAAHFIQQTSDNYHHNSSNVNQVVREEVNNTRKLLKPLIDVNHMTIDRQLKSQWITNAQMWLTGLQGIPSSKLEIKSFVLTQPSDAEPALFGYDSFSIYTFTELLFERSQVYDPFKTSPVPIEMKSKMYDGRRVQMAMLRKTMPESSFRSCRDINYAAYLTAYYTSSEEARTRFDQLHPGFIFHNDIIVPTKLEWERQRLKLQREGNVLHVTSIAWRSAIGGVYNDTGGLLYCKLLPPPRVMQWIYVDAYSHENSDRNLQL